MPRKARLVRRPDHMSQYLDDLNRVGRFEDDWRSTHRRHVLQGLGGVEQERYARPRQRARNSSVLVRAWPPVNDSRAESPAANLRQGIRSFTRAYHVGTGFLQSPAEVKCDERLFFDDEDRMSRKNDTYPCRRRTLGRLAPRPWAGTLVARRARRKSAGATVRCKQNPWGPWLAATRVRKQQRPTKGCR
jgi:hypothetical protein